MPDDILINKAATIERCVARAREEYDRDPGHFCHGLHPAGRRDSECTACL